METCGKLIAQSCHFDSRQTCSETSRMSHSSPHMSSTEITPEIVVSSVANTPICGDETHNGEFISKSCVDQMIGNN